MSAVLCLPETDGWCERVVPGLGRNVAVRRVVAQRLDMAVEEGRGGGLHRLKPVPPAEQVDEVPGRQVLAGPLASHRAAILRLRLRSNVGCERVLPELGQGRASEWLCRMVEAGMDGQSSPSPPLAPGTEPYPPRLCF